jgi:hypothetical protein
MEKKTLKFIDLSTDKIKEIADIKGVTIQSVYGALKYKSNTPLAMLIRAWALNNGGVEYVAQEPSKPLLPS